MKTGALIIASGDYGEGQQDNEGIPVNILASRNHDSGVVGTNIPDTETTLDWLDCH